jgi:hypothetical protein
MREPDKYSNIVRDVNNEVVDLNDSKDFNYDPEIRDKDWEAMLEQQRAENEAVRKEMGQPKQRVLNKLEENVKNALKPKKPKGY